jgi:hypothetical protein
MDFDYFSGKDLALPKHPKRPLRLAHNHTSKDARDYADAIAQFESAMVDYHAEISDYNTKTRARKQELKDTLRDVNDLNEDQFDLLWNFAWEAGHDEGLHRVVDMFDEYLDLATQFAKLSD